MAVGLGMFVGFLIGGQFGTLAGREYSQREAVAAGVAYYAVDPATGQTWLVYSNE